MSEPLTQTATVVAVSTQDGHTTAKLNCPLNTPCQGCAERQGCSSGILASARKPREAQIEIELLDSTQPLRAGSQVELELPAAPLLQAACWIYLLPLVGLIGGALLGEKFFANEGLTLFSGLIGGGLAWLIGRKQLNRYKKALTPIVKRRV